MGKKSVALCIVVGLFVAILSSFVTFFIVSKIDEKTMKNGTVTLDNLEQKLDDTKQQITKEEKKLKSLKKEVVDLEDKISKPKEIYNVSLHPGQYKVGVDLEPGVYHFKFHYRRKSSICSEWIHVLQKDSKGYDETIEGIKYDYRIEGREDGEEIEVKFNEGDKIWVTGDLGGEFKAAKE